MNTELFIPTVTTVSSGTEHNMDLLSYEFLKDRIIKIGEINSNTAGIVVSKMRYLNKIGFEDIKLVINSPGGDVSAGMMIYDAIKDVECDVVTIGTGVAASMGAFLLAAGTKGKRYATANVDIMIHQPLGSASGQATDITVVAKHIQSIKEKLAKIMAENVGQPKKKITSDMDRDYWLTASEAVEYGIVDHIGFPK